MSCWYTTILFIKMEILKYERYQFIGRQTTGHSNPVLKLKVNPWDESSNPSFVELAEGFLQQAES